MSTDGMQGAGGGYGQQPPPPVHPPVPPPGYGYPQQPQPPAPPQPYGYGYGSAPQAPQAVPPQAPPPVPPPGYGYPQQPQQGYQQPPQGYQQPPQGYQQPPQGYLQPSQGYGHIAPVGPPQPGNTRKKPVGLIIVLVMAVLVLSGAGFGAWYVLVGSASNNVLWSVPASEAGTSAADAAQRAETRGTWFTDKAVVHALSDGVKAYDLGTGKQLWATALPGDSNETCAAPENSSGDIGIVAYGEGKACDHLVAYDLGSGKELWNKNLKPGDSTSQYDVSVARAGDVVVVGAGAVTLALKVSDGTQAWNPKRYATDDCGAGGFTGGKALIRVRHCQYSDFDDPRWGQGWDEVSLVDPATGKARWTYHLDLPEDSVGGELSSGDVISTSPVVLLRNGEDGEALFSLDDETGKVRSEFSPAKPAEYVQTWDGAGGPWSEAGTFGDTFVINVSDGNDKGLLVAYDLDGGKQLWKTESAEFTDFYPLPAAGSDRILAYKTNNDNDKGPELVELGAQDGSVKTVVEYPADVDKGMDTFARPYWHEDRLYVSEGNPNVISGETAYSLVALPVTD